MSTAPSTAPRTSSRPTSPAPSTSLRPPAPTGPAKASPKASASTTSPPTRSSAPSAPTGQFTEHTPYDPRSPYSASKAASDHLVRAWARNLRPAGRPDQLLQQLRPLPLPEKLIPVTILNALHGKPIPVYGNGENIRDWLYVEDHADALLLVLEKGQLGRSYNIGGENERRNIDLVRTICALLDEMAPKATPMPTRSPSSPTAPATTPATPSTPPASATNSAGAPRVTVEEGLRRTVRWYLDNESWWRPLLDRQGRGRKARQGLMETLFFIASKTLGMARPARNLGAPPHGLTLSASGAGGAAGGLVAGPPLHRHPCADDLPLGDLLLRPLEQQFPARPALTHRRRHHRPRRGRGDRGLPPLGRPATERGGRAADRRRHAGPPLSRMPGWSSPAARPRRAQRRHRPTPRKWSATLGPGLGIAPDRILLEQASRNTAENARLTRDLVSPARARPGSSSPRPSTCRAPIETFDPQGWDGHVPWPVDFRSGDLADGRGIWRLDRNLLGVNLALKRIPWNLGLWDDRQMKLLVFGKTGQVARELQRLLPHARFLGAR
jgi:dTDP-4-dehydrorhamnose reductase